MSSQPYKQAMANAQDELVGILERSGPKSASELKAMKVTPRTISVAVKREIVKDEAAIREHKKGRKGKDVSRYVALYYLTKSDLDKRSSGVLVLRSGLEEDEENAIQQYFTKNRDLNDIWLGNIERELGLILSDNIELCVKRKGQVLKLARYYGIEVHDGINEAIPIKGSKRWFQVHRNDVVEKVDQFLNHPPLTAYRPPVAKDLQQLLKGDDWTLKVGSRIGGIIYESRVKTFKADVLREFVAKELHAPEEKRNELSILLDQSVETCEKALTSTETIWNKIEQITTEFVKEAKVNQTDRLSQQRLSCSLYLLMFTKTTGKDAGELVVTYPKIMAATGGVDGEWKDHPLLSYRAEWLGGEEWDDYLLINPMEMKASRLLEWIQPFEDITNDENLQHDLLGSLDELYKSDEYMSRFLEEIRRLKEKWKRGKFEGKCDTCRNVIDYYG